MKKQYGKIKSKDIDKKILIQLEILDKYFPIIQQTSWLKKHG